MVNFSSIFVREVYCGDWERVCTESERERERRRKWRDAMDGRTQGLEKLV
jgi:hypothetical protein